MCEYAYSDADLLITGAEQGLRPDRASVHHKGGVQQVRERTYIGVPMHAVYLAAFTAIY